MMSLGDRLYEGLAQSGPACSGMALSRKASESENTMSEDVLLISYSETVRQLMERGLDANFIVGYLVSENFVTEETHSKIKNSETRQESNIELLKDLLRLPERERLTVISLFQTGIEDRPCYTQVVYCLKWIWGYGGKPSNLFDLEQASKVIRLCYNVLSATTSCRSVVSPLNAKNSCGELYQKRIIDKGCVEFIHTRATAKEANEFLVDHLCNTANLATIQELISCESVPECIKKKLQESFDSVQRVKPAVATVPPVHMCPLEEHSIKGPDICRVL